MKIALAQINVETAHPMANLKKAAEWIEQAAKQKADLIVFPEMWTTGFHWNENKQIAPAHEEVLHQIADLAQKHRIWVTGSTLYLSEEKKITNTAILFDDKGDEISQYSKTHLFSLLGENQHMDSGNCFTAVDTPWGKIGFAICYDLRFPEMFRHYALNEVKMVILPAAFPHPRLDHWKTLIRARAIENQFFMVGVNQVGSEKVGGEEEVNFFGHSCVIDPWGATLAEAEEEETLLITDINLSLVEQTRNKIQVFKDRRTDLYS